MAIREERKVVSSNISSPPKIATGVNLVDVSYLQSMALGPLFSTIGLVLSYSLPANGIIPTGAEHHNKCESVPFFGTFPLANLTHSAARINFQAGFDCLPGLL